MSSVTEESKNQTLLEAVRSSLLKAANYNPGEVEAPCVILWTDADGQWGPLVDRLRLIIPCLLTLGEYDEDNRIGPAIWLRCVIEPEVRKEHFPNLDWDDAIPVIYMPGVSRQDLSDAEECPDRLRPLVELQFRGRVWTQKSGRDWTIRAYLVNPDEGLSLDVARDQRTGHAMHRALSTLSKTSVAQLEGRRLEADDFDRLLIPDAPGALLSWMSAPDTTRANWTEPHWDAFCERCRREYGFDPESDGEITAAERLGERAGPWQLVWDRFVNSPHPYPGIAELLRSAEPGGQASLFDLDARRDAWPGENEKMEDKLREALKELPALSPSDARNRLRELEAEHGQRRDWVWQRLDMSPLATVLAHLVILADRTIYSFGGESPDAMARSYAEQGYLVDDAVVRALAGVQSQRDSSAVEGAVSALYLPWIDDAARHLQECINRDPLPDATNSPSIDGEPRECLLFVDGLRLDLGQRLVGLAEDRGIEGTLNWRWAATPTMTATAKYAVSPVAKDLVGGQPGTDFCPDIGESGKQITAERFRKLLSEKGYQVFDSKEVGDPTQDDARGWTESGEFDTLGHKMDIGLAPQVEYQLKLIAGRVQDLLSAGWETVRVVTDHGWLLVPGGLPKAHLPKYLTVTRGARCAAIRDTSNVDVPVSAWFWNSQERFAHPAGAHVFVAGNEYAHGGISLQECVIPVITFSGSGVAEEIAVSVESIHWVGFRCRVTVSPAIEGLSVDIRTKPSAADSSISSSRQIDEDGRAALMVADDSLEGTSASLVVFDEAGRILSREPVVVGEDI